MKSVRKIFSFIICLALILASVSFSSSSAAAAEDDGTLDCIDILNYSMPNDGASVRVYVYPGDVVRFNLPFTFATYFWDLIIQTLTALSTAEIVGNSSSVYLTVSQIESNIYRCYGSSSGAAFSTANIGVHFAIIANTLINKGISIKF